MRIGGVIHGIGAEIEDSDGWIWPLVQALDGQRGPLEIATEMAGTHPVPSESDVLEAIADLRRAGFLEDAAALPPGDLSEGELTRYSRGVPLLRWMDLSPRTSSWDLQLALRRARVLLIGLGGVGGVAAQGLVASGVGLLHCVDPDLVELSNLNRQILYRERDIGRRKVDVALESLRALNSDVVVTGEAAEVRDVEDLRRLLRPGELPAGGYDLLVLSADRPAAIRSWANEACIETDTPWIEGGYRGPLVSAGAFTPGRSGCLECRRATLAESRDLGLPPGECEEVVSPRMPWSPVNAVTASLAGALFVYSATAVLTGVPRLPPGFRLDYNLMRPADSGLEPIPRRSDCRVCGER
ncbi:HesA/MoeB/ThiF family protein [Streptomyces alkaliterrae]|uniref:HesA/MoeB/ThiF family protein n=1 Tax=Streptomyces alkaliterrae TaxID=2213162 RepID=UPI002B208350|nr:ThiF family adenylyltransferase [Streptomyces alkaliterrae]